MRNNSNRCILYHGSEFQIQTPVFGGVKVHNDYGQGFYCTENTEMAKEWACKGKEPPAFSNAYELDLTDLTVLDLSKAPYTVLDWIAVLLKNRTFEIDLEIAHEVRDYLIDNFLPPIDQSDVIIGYRADDSCFNYATNFVNNGLSGYAMTERAETLTLPSNAAGTGVPVGYGRSIP